MKKPKIVFAFDAITETTVNILHDLGYHVVLFEPGVTIRPELIQKIEEAVRVHEQQTLPDNPKRFFINDTGEVQ